jgi:Na+-translocating ferredoxin:NAD+ oxidoreductase RnfG subunit
MKASAFRRFYPFVLVILVAALTFSLAIVTQNFTREEIQSHLDQETLELLQQLVPDVGYYVLNDDIYTVYSGGGVRAGYAFYGEGSGYGGKMKLFIGLKDRDTIQGVIVLSNNETDAYWQRLYREDFFSQFKGLLIEDCYVRLYIGGTGEVDGVSGSTVSSRGVADGVRKTALEKIKSIIN